MQQSTSPALPKINAAAPLRLVHHDLVWDAVLPGLRELYEAVPDPEWDIGLVREMLDMGRWLMIVDDRDPTSFFVVRMDESPYHEGELELFIYLAYHRGGNAWSHCVPQLETVARNAGARHIRFSSRRPGMPRLAHRAGYQPHAIEFVKELP